MKKQWQSLILLCMAWVALAAPASAVPVVATDTTYTVYLQRSGNANVAFGSFRFDGGLDEIPYEDGFVRVTESETVVDPSSSRINITLSSNTNLFPAVGDVALLGIGTGGDGLDLLLRVSLIDARISFFEQDGTFIDATDNLVSEATQADPWDGTFPNPSQLLGIGEIGNRNVQVISFDFIVSTQEAEVPEPGILLLGGAGLLAFAAARRRKVVAKRR